MNHPVILFDGACNLCNRAVDFVIRRDQNGIFRFASLQSNAGKELLHAHALGSAEMDSIVLIEDGIAYLRSTAVLRIARRLGKLWPVFYCFIRLPDKLRDAVYNAIANRRYRWFGKKGTCRVPAPEERARFLE